MSHFDRIQENINILRYNVGVTETIEDIKKYEDDPNKMSTFSLSRMTSPGFSEWETLEGNPNYECNDGVCRLKNEPEKTIPDMRRRFKSDEIFGKRFQTDLISPFNGPLFMNRDLNSKTSEINNNTNLLPDTYSNPIMTSLPQQVNMNNQIMNNDLVYNTSEYSSWQSDNDNTFKHTMENTNGKVFKRESNYVEGGSKLFRTN